MRNAPVRQINCQATLNFRYFWQVEKNKKKWIVLHKNRPREKNKTAVRREVSRWSTHITKSVSGRIYCLTSSRLEIALKQFYLNYIIKTFISDYFNRSAWPWAEAGSGT